LVAFALAVAGCAPAPPPSAAASPTPPPIPEASFTGGTGNARLTLPQKVAWDGGYCDRGTDDAWLALNIGSPNGAEYFGLVVGQSPYTPGATRTASGGGRFGGEDAAVTWRGGGTAANLARDGLVVTVETDLSRGSFSGHLPDGTEVSGGFSC
jgi:hypothetical protein